MITTSPSAVTAWAKCERQWWLERRAGPFDMGLKPTRKRINQTIGIATHYAAAWALREGVDSGVRKGVGRLRGILASRPLVSHDGLEMQTTPELVSESTALVEALTRAYMRLWVPKPLQFIDEPFAVQIADDIRLMVRPDIVSLTEPTEAAPWDFKTIERIDAGWIASLGVQPQTIAYRLALKQLFENVGPMRYVGMARGARRNGTLSNPLIYGYAAQAIRPFNRGLVSHERSGKMQRFEAWRPWSIHKTDPLREWISELPVDVISKQFIEVKVQASDETEAEWTRAVVVRERDLHSRPNNKEAFPMTGMLQGRCLSSWGRCPFFEACHGGQERSAALYEPREPQSYEYDAEAESEVASGE